MATLAELLASGAQAGLKDDSFGQAYGKAADRAAGLEQLLKKQAIAKKESEDAVALLKTNPSLSSAHVGGASVARRDNNANMQASIDRATDDERLETQALQKAFNDLGLAKTREQYKALQTSKQHLADPKAMDAEKIAAMQRNLVETGVMTDKDLNRYFPTSARSITNSIGAFFGKPEVVAPYSQEQLDGLRAFTADQENVINARLRAGKADLERRAPHLAPTLNRRKTLPTVLQSLGGEEFGLTQNAQPQGGNVDLKSAAATELAKRRGKN